MLVTHLLKGLDMKFFASLVMCSFSLCAFASQVETTTDTTKSVLKNETVSSEASTPASATKGSCDCKSATLAYRGKENIPPCAVQKGACLSFRQKNTDACCNTTLEKVTVEVPICAPPCPTKESVTRSRNGKRAVYDFGRYEAVVRATEDGDIDVKYRKRLLDR